MPSFTPCFLLLGTRCLDVLLETSPSPWEPVPVRPFLGKEAAKEGLSADMDVSRAH